MFSEKNLIYIFTMLECIEKIWIYSKKYKNIDEFMFADEQQPLNASVSLFIAIGEESKKIDTDVKDKIDYVNWSDVKGLRDKISHDYRGVNADILWQVIHSDLNNLKDGLVEMVSFIHPPSEIIDEFVSSPYYSHLQYLKK